MSYAQKTAPVLLKNVTIIDGDASVKPRKGSLLVENGIIRSISSGELKNNNRRIKVIDCSGKFIVPGLIDSHVHLATVVPDNLQKAHLITDSIIGNMLRHGITTVRDMAGDAMYLSWPIC